jgi:hypothetical protein
MNFVFNITTPKNTPESSPQKTILKLAKGIIRKTEIQFPPGAAGLLHVKLARSVYQPYPYNPDSDYIGDGQTIELLGDVYMLEAPTQLEAYTWNKDDTYEHMVIIRIVMTPIPKEALLTPEDLEQKAKEREE